MDVDTRTLVDATKHLSHHCGVLHAANEFLDAINEEETTYKNLLTLSGTTDETPLVFEKLRQSVGMMIHLSAQHVKDVSKVMDNVSDKLSEL